MKSLAAFAFACLPALSWCQEAADFDIAVDVRREGEFVVVNVDCPVDAPRAIVWDVLTDYDHMARYISTLELSKVEKRDGNLLRVHQKGSATRGLWTIEFDNHREVELVPHDEVRTRIVSGDMTTSTFVTRIVEVDKRLHIAHNGRYTTDHWIPPLIGVVMIRSAIRAQFVEIRAEVQRRSALAQPPS